MYNAMVTLLVEQLKLRPTTQTALNDLDKKTRKG